MEMSIKDKNTLKYNQEEKSIKGPLLSMLKIIWKVLKSYHQQKWANM